MVRIVLCFCLLTVSLETAAQGTRLDLTKNPNSHPANPNQSNVSMLRAASANKPDTNLLKPKGFNEGTYTGKGMNNDQMLNMQSTQYKLGNTKATSTIYYDESGRVKGTNTTIGGK